LVGLSSFESSLWAAGEADQLRKEVRSLTRQLASDRLADREQAEQALLELGPAVLARLPESNDRLPAETRRRLDRIRRQLERQQSRAAAAGQRLSIKATARPLSRVIAQLEQLSGNRIIDFREIRRQSKIEVPITVDLQDVSFWEALDRIMDEAGMSVYHFAHDDQGNPLRGIAFIARDPVASNRSGRADYNAGFRFDPIRIIAQRDYRDPAANGLEIYLEVHWEPRLRPIQLVLLRNTITAIDQRDGELKRRGNGQSEIAIDRSAAFVILPFQLPGYEVHTIQRLGGELECLLPGQIETFRIENLPGAAGEQQKKADVAVRLLSVRREGAVWDLRIRVHLEDATGALESHLSDWVLRNEAYLEHESGDRIEPADIQKTSEQDDHFGVAFRFKTPKDIEGYTFVYKTPTAFIKRRIPFHLNNLPLP
jgi:hypothetical protein